MAESEFKQRQMCLNQKPSLDFLIRNVILRPHDQWFHDLMITYLMTPQTRLQERGMSSLLSAHSVLSTALQCIFQLRIADEKIQTQIIQAMHPESHELSSGGAELNTKLVCLREVCELSAVPTHVLFLQATFSNQNHPHIPNWAQTAVIFNNHGPYQYVCFPCWSEDRFWLNHFRLVSSMPRVRRTLRNRASRNRCVTWLSRIWQEE